MGAKKKVQPKEKIERKQLLPILQKIQDKKGYISDNDMQAIADDLGMHPVEVYSVVTFYSFLKTKKEGKHTIRVSNCVSNVMAGSQKVFEAFKKEISGLNRERQIVNLEETGCLGMCDQSPAAMIDGQLVGRLTVKEVKKIIAGFK